jgi:GntR family transcriptional regulator
MIVFIRIAASSGVPVTRQIMDQIRTQCASGTLKAGQRLPSVRVLARELMVNQNTILKVYERLTMEGLLERRHGDGTYVAVTVGQAGLKIRKDLLRGQVERLVHQAVALGLEVEQVHKAIDQVWARIQGKDMLRENNSHE